MEEGFFSLFLPCPFSIIFAVIVCSILKVKKDKMLTAKMIFHNKKAKTAKKIGLLHYFKCLN